MGLILSSSRLPYSCQRRETRFSTPLPWSLYARLEEYVSNIARSMGMYNAMTYTETGFLQIFLWQGCGAVAPKPIEFSAIEMIETTIGGVKRWMQSAPYMSRAGRWPRMKQANNKSRQK